VVFTTKVSYIYGRLNLNSDSNLWEDLPEAKANADILVNPMKQGESASQEYQARLQPLLRDERSRNETEAYSRPTDD
jgi:hypothetical protein